VAVAGKHRAEAFVLLTEFLNRLKRDVPIWKRRSIPVRPGKPATVARAPAAPSAVVAGAGRDGVLSADEVRALLWRLCEPLSPEQVPLPLALGRVLRDPVAAPEDQPPFDRAAVDGYALRTDDPALRFRVVDDIRAGDWKPRVLRPGEAVRIATGGALPAAGLQVVPREMAQVEGDVLVLVQREAETNVRCRGDDARAGQVLIEAGTVLSAGALALLASVGAAKPCVTRQPRVVHLLTGNEIVPPDQIPARGQIRDSNSTLVRSFLRNWEVVPSQERIPEDEGALARALSRWAPAADLLLISGGASGGEHDFTRRALVAADFAILVHGTTARPGKPLLVGRRGAALAIGLPGNPLAHFVGLHLYVRAALEGWSGQTVRTQFNSGQLAMGLEAATGSRETFWPARWWLADGMVLVAPRPWNNSGDLTGLATANALLRVPPGANRLLPGSRVDFLCLESH
jgi:molybdopterin molybdotransferase